MGEKLSSNTSGTTARCFLFTNSFLCPGTDNRPYPPNRKSSPFGRGKKWHVCRKFSKVSSFQKIQEWILRMMGWAEVFLFEIPEFWGIHGKFQAEEWPCLSTGYVVVLRLFLCLGYSYLPIPLGFITNFFCAKIFLASALFKLILDLFVWWCFTDSIPWGKSPWKSPPFGSEYFLGHFFHAHPTSKSK